ncbi:MAG: UvrD-helicase domain-containing protein [Planctomycetia bacterium]|nr:UvrD-helicase domain-containing protein [Planctomycetia bacterium]
MGQRARNDGLTDQQRDAISARGVSVALSAGAGCGKTFVLTRRFLSHLEPDAAQGARLTEIVAITFTERAAREMRDRIRGACQERVDGPGGASPHWLETLRDLETARISTIHAFCSSLLRTHAVEAGIDPHFTTLDQAQAMTLASEAVDDELRLLVESRDETALELATVFGVAALRGMLLALLNRRHEVDFAAWREKRPEDLVAVWQAAHAEHVVPGLLAEVAGGDAARELLAFLQDHSPHHAEMKGRCAVLRESLPKLRRAKNAQKLLEEIRENAQVKGGGLKEGWESEDVYERVKELLEKLRKQVDHALADLNFDPVEARRAAVAGWQLLQLAERVFRAYDERKRGLACLDFDDLLIRARDLLVAPQNADLKGRLQAQIKFLLVDEFQDTDPLQVELVKALCGDELTTGKLFFVGDYKQSIYRFRRADPKVFARLRDAIPKAGRLPLTRNFRSQPAILDFVNALFVESLPGPYEPLEPHRTQVSPRPAVEFLWATPPQDDEEGTTIKDSVARQRQREARWIARRIRAIIDGRQPLVWDKEAEKRGKPAARPATKRDIAVLLRALSDVDLYEKALQEWGIDYYLVGGHAFYAQQEIFDLLNLLRAVACPDDPVSLAGALRSPLLGLSDEALFLLSRHKDGLCGGLFAGPPKELDAIDRPRVVLAAKAIARLRARKDRVPIAALVEEALRATGYDALLLAEFLGERKLANLHKLIDQARQFDASAVFSLDDFLTQLAQFVAVQPKEPLAATQAESDDVVRLMTIHQAKGLEFPIVIVPDLGRQSRADLGARAVFDPQLGPLVRPPGMESMTGYDIRRQLEEAEDEEELVRLFYVATTRAADYLILSSGVGELGKARELWMDVLARRFNLATGAVLGKLPEGYSLPQVRVTTDEPPAPSAPSHHRRRNAAEVAADAREAIVSQVADRPRSVDPLAVDAAARREFSFSRLRGTLHPVGPGPTDGEPAERAEMRAISQPLPDDKTAIDLGVLVHEALEGIDLKRDYTANTIRAAVDERAIELSVDPALCSDAADLVWRFVQSPRMGQLRKARRVYRELEFLLAWPPSMGEKGARDRVAGERRFIRGYIDCLYEDAAGRWHLLDFKTNRATPQTAAAVAAAYDVQMIVYGMAVERVLRAPPAELVLCFLRPGVEHAFRLDERSRNDVVRRVNEALQAYISAGAP